MNKIIILIMFILLSGCSMKFAKQGATETSFKKDWNDCRVKMGQARLENNNPATVTFMQECMEGQGYERI